MNDMAVKECFRNTMENIGISDSFYSLDGYKEGASCLIQQNGQWIVFEAERAEKFDKKEYNHIQQACLEIIRRFTYSQEDYAFLSEKFLDEVKKSEKSGSRMHYTAEPVVTKASLSFGSARAASRKRSAYKDALALRAGRRNRNAGTLDVKRNNSAARKKSRSVGMLKIGK